MSKWKDKQQQWRWEERLQDCSSSRWRLLLLDWLKLQISKLRCTR
jgi:hypothetical protein